MDQPEILYAYSSIVIAFCLFLSIIIFNELGFQVGRFVQSHTDDEVKALTGSIQASILGLLALMLGFTFSMSMQRYDDRNKALIEEANAIGTAVLRAELLPAEFREQALEVFKKYVSLRVAVGKLDFTRSEERKKFNLETGTLQSELWNVGVSAANVDPRPVTTGSFITALNELIDTQNKRNALLQMHVPEVVLILLFMVFLSSGVILGYSAGLTGQRLVVPIILVSLLITLIVFIIIDLDRPRRGLITVDQSVLRDLEESII